tara:strand:+ start:11549 stop:12607 length:1059 start_codon:yes stop_codon:yes gene_type:complete
MSFLNDQVDLLINGKHGEEVIRNLKEHFKTHYSFEKNVSNVRRLFLERNIKNVAFDQKFNEIREYIMQSSMPNDCIEKFDKFKMLSLIDQYDTIARTKKSGFFPGYTVLNEKIMQLKLLPENMETFKLEEQDMLVCKQQKRETLLHKNRVAIILKRPKHILDKQIQILEEGSKNKIDEILALLLVSGRREAEILNGKSEFTSIPNLPFHVYFTGVLKKKSNPMDETSGLTIIIPLLCKSEVFLKAFQRMRASQKEDIIHLSNKQVSNRYCSQLNSARKTRFPMIHKTHDLRGLYIKMVDQYYIHSLAFPYLCMMCLGHDAIEDSLHYQKINITENDLEKINTLEIDSFPQKS